MCRYSVSNPRLPKPRSRSCSQYGNQGYRNRKGLHHPQCTPTLGPDDRPGYQHHHTCTDFLCIVPPEDYTLCGMKHRYLLHASCSLASLLAPHLCSYIYFPRTDSRYGGTRCCRCYTVPRHVYRTLPLSPWYRLRKCIRLADRYRYSRRGKIQRRTLRRSRHCDPCSSLLTPPCRWHRDTCSRRNPDLQSGSD